MNTIYGYCRISTPKQSIERQVRNIQEKYPEAVIVKDVYTGRTMNRPNWHKLMSTVKSGDTIVFDEVSRMSRNADEGYETYQKLYQQGINLIFLKESYLNTDTYKKNIIKRIEPSKTGERTTDKFIQAIVDALTEYVKDLSKDQIRSAFKQSQDEVDYLSRRTKEGLETAKLNGKQVGRKKGRNYITKKEKELKPEIKRLSRNFDGSNTDKEVMKLLNVSKNTYYKYKKKLLMQN